jgi:hypothetical protein
MIITQEAAQPLAASNRSVAVDLAAQSMTDLPERGSLGVRELQPPFRLSLRFAAARYSFRANSSWSTIRERAAEAHGRAVELSTEFGAMQEALPDLERLARYERRTRSRLRAHQAPRRSHKSNDLLLRKVRAIRRRRELPAT